MVDRTKHSAARNGDDARVVQDELFAERPATPCAMALDLIGAKTRAQGVALFQGRANPWQVRDWRLGRRGMPQWAINLLRAELDRRAGLYQRLQTDLASCLSRGMDWNKNATRGLGEWRAKQNLQKRD